MLLECGETGVLVWGSGAVGSGRGLDWGTKRLSGFYNQKNVIDGKFARCVQIGTPRRQKGRRKSIIYSYDPAAYKRTHQDKHGGRHCFASALTEYIITYIALNLLYNRTNYTMRTVFLKFYLYLNIQENLAVFILRQSYCPHVHLITYKWI